MEYSHSNFGTFAKVLDELGHPLRPGQLIVDFGCGGGIAINQGRGMGYNVVGCDVDFDHQWISDKVLAPLVAADIIRPIQLKPYRLPYDDHCVDVLFSDNVMEHVQNYAEVIAEQRRILRPGGIILHSFPSIFTPVERHVFIPLATVFRPYWWLRLWAQLGIRNPYYLKSSAKVYADHVFDYLRSSTNYQSPWSIRRQFLAKFTEARYVERAWCRHSKVGRIANRLGPLAGPFSSGYGLLKCRVLFGRA